MTQSVIKEGRRFKLNTKKHITGFLFVLPAILMFLVFVIIPLCIALVLSFYKADRFFYSMEFIGWQNFIDAFNDGIFKQSLGNIFLYVLMSLPMTVILSLLMALLLNANKKGSKVFRLLFYLPSVTSAVAASIVWLWLMEPSTGLLNQILGVFGFGEFTWLNHSSTALFSVTIVTVWMGLGGNMIIFLAALQGLPAEIYEAAKIDGASRVKCFFKLTIPFIAPTIFFVFTMTLIGAFQLYDQVFVLTGGGPVNSTMTPVYWIYENAFGTLGDKAGYASSLSFILFVIIMAITFVVRGIMRKVNSEV